jgi:hypothetical protein
MLHIFFLCYFRITSTFSVFIFIANQQCFICLKMKWKQNHFLSTLKPPIEGKYKLNYITKKKKKMKNKINTRGKPTTVSIIDNWDENFQFRNNTIQYGFIYKRRTKITRTKYWSIWKYFINFLIFTFTFLAFISKKKKVCPIEIITSVCLFFVLI